MEIVAVDNAKLWSLRDTYGYTWKSNGSFAVRGNDSAFDLIAPWPEERPVQDAEGALPSKVCAASEACESHIPEPLTKREQFALYAPITYQDAFAVISENRKSSKFSAREVCAMLATMRAEYADMVLAALAEQPQPERSE